MNNVARYLLAAALLALLAACGNKGPLVRPSAAATRAPVASPPATDPTNTTPVEETPPPPAVAPDPVTPPATPGGGHG
jgi:predicted small lipoprotein YifL